MKSFFDSLASPAASDGECAIFCGSGKKLMSETGCELMLLAGQDRKIRRLDDLFIAKWKEFFGRNPEISMIQKLIFDSDQLCLSEKYSFSDEFSLSAPALFWNQQHKILITADFFTGTIMGFLSRTELNNLTNWEALTQIRRKCRV